MGFRPTGSLARRSILVLVGQCEETMIASSTIKRVVSSFILSNNQREDLEVAVFHRVDTMPSFPSHWAACSGSIDKGETPWEAARRELLEETKFPEAAIDGLRGGLYLDVLMKSHETTIRVYPFAVHLPPHWKLELRGREHDSFEFITISELEILQPTVPDLSKAFHHATRGQYLPSAKLTPAIRDWSSDKVSGAAIMARNAIQLVVENSDTLPATLRMMRPSMVAITNALDRLSESTPTQVIEALQGDAERAANYAALMIQPLIEQQQQSNRESPFTIATHSRSSTILAVLRLTLQNCCGCNIRILCSKSTPGDEGILMAHDVGHSSAECVDDGKLLEMMRSNSIDLLLTGCDCLTDKDVVNKIGTSALAQAAATSNRTKTFCCADRWKQWRDIFPPPLEDIFECTPLDLFDAILMPPSPFSAPT